MIKRLYLVNGNLTQPLDINEENIAVDANTANQLNILNIGDWCYLTIIESGKLEVIKITKFPSWYWVDRGQDGTDQFSFSTQAKIVYLLTAQEIEDAVSGTPLSIYPNGYGALEVNTGVNSWQISYTEFSIQTLGGLSWMNPDGYEIIVIDNNGMFGCCDGSLTGAPYPGGIFFYLTSELYAVLNIEGYVGINKSDTANIPPLNANDGWWLLTQPSLLEEYIASPISVNTWQLYGGQQIFNSTEQYVLSSISVGQIGWNIYGGQKSFSSQDKYIGQDSYILEMQLYGGAVTYNNGIDKYILPTISVLNWTLQ